MRRISLLLLLLSFQVTGQDLKEAILSTTIKEATVFMQGAQVTRTGKVNVDAGKSIIKVKSLSPYLNEKSVQVKADGDFTILSVNHKLNYLADEKRDAQLDSLQQLEQALALQISQQKARTEVLKEKQSVLGANKNLSGANSTVTLAQLKQAIEFYDKELSEIKSEELKVLEQIKQLEERRVKLTKQIQTMNQETDLPHSEIEIRVEAKSRTVGDFTLTYMVNNAGWFPKYDIRSKDIETPIELRYKAEVYQNTGEDWHNIRLRFSNGNPNKSGVAPQLRPWYLNFARNTVFKRPSYETLSIKHGSVSGRVMDENGEPLAGVTVLVMGTNIGSITDIGGNYSLTLPNGATDLMFSFIGYETQTLPITSEQINVRMNPDLMELSEVVVVGYGIAGRVPGVSVRDAPRAKKAETVTTTTIENPTTVEFEVETPYTIKSNGEKMTIDLSTYDIAATYKYYAVPKIEKEAFLMAEITNWDQYNLMEGEANLYFEDTYVGRSILEATLLKDTLSISFGRDRNIAFEREKIKDYTKKRAIGSNQIENIGLKTTIKNKKSQPIKVTIFDQVPVSAISDIVVSATEVSNGKLEEGTGIITWEINMQPQEQRELILQYEVKYPRRESVILE